ncbi:hypothetical protein, partial [Phaeobacter sp. HF9A]|uniref:hypothetical protein n=1 Tax=Phaeobacter sp. HF9A TaxID=2721561 RepID=UPI00142FC414|nr:hypothetical protein [Phaeobacter sp. HF9A]
MLGWRHVSRLPLTPMSQDRPPLSFGRSFWLLLILPRAGVLALLWAMNQLLALPLWLAGALLASDTLLLLAQLRQYHLSAERHIRDTGAMALSWGGYLACLLAVFASATLWWDTLLIATRPPAEERFDLRMQREREALYRLELSPDRRVLRFEGEITYGLKPRILQAVNATPELREIQLTSPGGQVFAARAAAQAILAAGLTTSASGDCASACTLLFLAGAERHLTPGARLGFHGYGLSMRVHLPGYDIKAAEAKDLAYLRSRGVSAEFTSRA